MKPWLDNPQLQTPTALKKALEYSENPAALTEILKECEFTVSMDGLRPYFPEETEERCIVEVSIKRGPCSIRFPFGLSLHDTDTLKYIWSPGYPPPHYGKIRGKHYDSSTLLLQAIGRCNKEIREGLLYSILASISAEYHVPRTFEEFCHEFGYDTDSLKVRRTFEGCRDHSECLQSIFSPEEIESFPS